MFVYSFSKWPILLLLRKLDIPWMQKCSCFWRIFSFKQVFFHNHRGLSFPTKVTTEHFSFLRCFESAQLLLSFLHWTRCISEEPKLFRNLTHLDFWNRVSPILLTWFQSWKSESKGVHLCWNIQVKFFNSFVQLKHSGSESPEIFDNPDSPWFLKCMFLQLYQLHFSVLVSIDNFSFAADYSLPKTVNFVLHIGIGVLIDKENPKCYKYWDFSIF